MAGWPNLLSIFLSSFSSEAARILVVVVQGGPVPNPSVIYLARVKEDPMEKDHDYDWLLSHLQLPELLQPRLDLAGKVGDFLKAKIQSGSLPYTVGVFGGWGSGNIEMRNGPEQTLQLMTILNLQSHGVKHNLEKTPVPPEIGLRFARLCAKPGIKSSICKI